MPLSTYSGPGSRFSSDRSTIEEYAARAGASCPCRCEGLTYRLNQTTYGPLAAHARAPYRCPQVVKCTNLRWTDSVQRDRRDIMQNNLAQFLAKRAELNPRLEALIDVATGQRFTYAALNGQVNQMAHALAGLGVRQGDRVATLLMNGLEFVEIFFGSAKIGAVLTPLNWRLVADELAFMLTDSGAETLVFGSEFNTVVAELHARGSQGTVVRTWIYVGKPADRPAFAVRYEDLHGTASEQEPET